MTWLRPLPGHGLRARAAVVVASVLAATGCAPLEVVRVVDGRPMAGPFVPVEAYEAYVRGSLAEASGDDRAALAAFGDAARLDPASPDPSVRAGAAACRLARPDAAAEAFAAAERVDPRFEPLWRARAECAAGGGRLGEAIAFARRAVSLDPERDATVLLLARLLERAGKPGEAGQWLRGLAVANSESRESWAAVRDQARRVGDGVWEQIAASNLRRLGGEALPELPLAPPPSVPLPDVVALVDASLLAGDSGTAALLLQRARGERRWVVPWALALGRVELARQTAERIVGADPADSDTRIALALCADLLGQADAALAALAWPADASAPTEVGELLLAELLARHGGQGALGSWSSLPRARAETAPAASIVHQTLLARLRRRGAG